MALPLAPNAELKQIATGFALAEGPVYSRRGYLLFTDIRNQRIHKWENGKLTTIRENSNKANGLTFDHQGRLLTAEGGGPVDAIFKAIRGLYPHTATLQLFQISAVTEGTDAQATVTVRLDENGRTVTGKASDTDTMAAAAYADVNALNKLVVKREKQEPEALSVAR